MSWLERLETKADPFYPEDLAYRGSVPRSAYPYSQALGTGLASNVIMAPLLWIMRNFTEAELVAERRVENLWERDEDLEAEMRLDQPNPFYGLDLLWKASIVSFGLDGNGYWQKVRNPFGEILGYWYLPHFLVEPVSPHDGSEFISHYTYRPYRGGQAIDLPVRDVVHLRYGLDPEDPRRGLSPLRPLLREVFTDEEASNFSAAILRNMGVPGGVIAPKDAAAAAALAKNKQAVDDLKAYMKNEFTADRRGEWLVLGAPTEVAQFGFDPNRLMLTQLRDISEERVCAMFGIPAAVVGFGAGLQQTKVGATMRELVRLAWVSCITPLQRSIAKQMIQQLLPDFIRQRRRFRLRFDNSTASAFQEDETERVRRTVMMTAGGVLRVDRAQEMLGLEVDPTQRVYLRPTSSTPVGPDAPEVPDPAPPPPPDDEDDDEAPADEREAEDTKLLRVLAARVGLNGHRQEER